MSKVFEDFLLFQLSQPLTEAADPSLFRVVFSIDTPGVMEQLKAGIMKGMVGVSDKREIRFNFLGVGRDSLLIMKAKDVLSQNSLREVNYGDPDSLLSKGMADIKRLTDKNDVSRALHVVFTYIEQAHELKGGSSADVRDVSWKFSQRIGMGRAPNSVKSLAKALYSLTQDLGSGAPRSIRPLSVKDWEAVVNKALLLFGSTFASEGEWEVTDSTLRIPKGSTLIFMTVQPEGIPPKMQQMMDTTRGSLSDVMGARNAELFMQEQDRIKGLRAELGGKYKLKFVTKSDWDKQQEKYFVRKRKRWEANR